jgi:outer membrane protein TolC
MKNHILKNLIVIVLLGSSLFGEVEPLTLEKAIELSKNISYDEKKILEEIKNDKLNRKNLSNDFYPDIFIDAQYGREKNLGKAQNDTFGYIVWKNKLYDSKESILSDEFKYNEKTNELALKQSMLLRKIAVMESFFDTSLAYLYQQYTLEQLAMDAIYSIRANDYYPSGRVSDIEVAQKDALMQLASAKNFSAEEGIYHARLKLANLLELDVSNLQEVAKPNLKNYLAKDIPNFATLLKLALLNDLTLDVLNQKLTFLEKKLKQTKDSFNIKVDSFVTYGNEPQKSLEDEKNRWEARIGLKVPLYDGGKNNNEVEKIQIEINKQKIAIDKYKVELNLKIEKSISRLKSLQRLDKAYSKELEYRNLYLERARISYELNRQSDLGDAMVAQTKAEYEFMKNRYEFVVAYELLNLLVGGYDEKK